MTVWILIVIAAIAADQITKFLAVKYLAPAGEPVSVIEGIFRFSYVENKGAAFGMLDNHRWIFMVISTVAIVAIVYYACIWKGRPKNMWVRVALALITGGGIGNMIDRVRLGYVIDFLDFCAFPNIWPWVFNVADAFVCVGAAIIIVYLIAELISESRKKPQTQNSSDGNAENSAGNSAGNGAENGAENNAENSTTGGVKEIRPDNDCEGVSKEECAGDDGDDSEKEDGAGNS